nr:immunoglobulin heavy chain junction region [Macaca mulatta]MOX59070.1 immunoglobulin heavy chain junction region [Macaca mulatta]MOX60933.1 immunoglobulin heavy chain junction region [Macaca mulatta]MOX61095.1 immunoglobulin heavy chain junction region [Macaca mulatta]MOX61410.1 immunoglobulin heavy chain junction region [Macaca mulatta]
CARDDFGSGLGYW